MRAKIRSIVSLLFLGTTIMSYAHGYSDIYERCTFESSNGVELKYRLLRPEKSDSVTDAKYPLVIFLHGAGERGDDNSSQLSNGGELFANEQTRQNFPAYVIFPQCPDKCFWSYRKAPKASKGPLGLKGEKKELPIMVALMELIGKYEKLPDVDPDRVYVVGISMGGLAVYDLVCRHPDVFAAAVPICGAVDPTRLDSVKNIPFRIFHGTKDDVIPVIASEVAYKTLKDEGDNVELIEFPDDGHDCWDSAFAYPDFMTWIFAQHKNAKSTNVLADNTY